MQECRECDSWGVVGCEFVVAGVDAAPVLETSDRTLDGVAGLVADGVERVRPLAGRVVGDHRLGFAVTQEGAERIAVVGGVGQAEGRGGKAGEQRLSLWGVAAVPRRQHKARHAAEPVRDQVDLGAASAARAAYGLAVGPPLPPAAERCALAVVLSISCRPPGVASPRAVSMPCHKPRPDQRWKRL